MVLSRYHREIHQDSNMPRDVLLPAEQLWFHVKGLIEVVFPVTELLAAAAAAAEFASTATFLFTPHNLLTCESASKAVRPPVLHWGGNFAVFVQALILIDLFKGIPLVCCGRLWIFFFLSSNAVGKTKQMQQCGSASLKK